MPAVSFLVVNLFTKAISAHVLSFKGVNNGTYQAILKRCEDSLTSYETARWLLYLLLYSLVTRKPRSSLFPILLREKDPGIAMDTGVMPGAF